MAEFEKGSVIGNYRIVRLLGQGGMGTVYEVEHLELGTHYALKTFTFDPKNDASHALKTKFLEEGKLLARLKHPNLTHVFDLGFEEGTQTPYFVMDLVTYDDGGSYTVEDVELSDIDEDMVYSWFKQLASALDYIHGEGIVHRDIKPGNLLIDSDLNVVLTDFGISRIFGPKIKNEVDATRTMVSKTGRGKLVLGTGHYIAPEVAAGEEATPKADAYALGVMLLRWLTGFYYGDNPGALALLSRKKYRWIGVVSRLLSPAERRPDNYTELVKMVKPVAKRMPVRNAPKYNSNRAREIIVGVVAGLSIIGVLYIGGYFAWWYIEGENAERDRKMAALAQQMRDREEADRKAREEAERKATAEMEARKVKEAEARRIAEEKRKAHEAKLAEEKRVEELRTKVEKQDASQLTVREAPTPVEDKKTKDEFIVIDSPKAESAKEKVDYGPIPDRNYVWLKGGNENNPLPVKFHLASGVTIDLIPRKPGIFYALNDWTADKNRRKVTLTYPYWIGKYCITAAEWREFDEGAVRDCLPIEKAVGAKYPVYKKMNRHQYDAFCEFLTDKYRAQLPNGYIFRLSTDAELEYAWELGKTEVLCGFDIWKAGVPFDGEVAKGKWELLRREKNLDAICKWNDQGVSADGLILVGGRTEPTASGLYELRILHILYDTCSSHAKLESSDEERNPLNWVSGAERNYSENIRTMRHSAFANRNLWGRMGIERDLARIVVGPNLVAQRAWERHEQPKSDVVNVPQINYAWKNPERAPTKVSKPKEIKFRRVGGAEMVFCTIPKGKFSMSNPEGQKKLSHKVELTKPFWMSKYCVTAAEWREFAKYDCEDEVCKTLEKNFPKNPIYVCFPRCKWVAYCKFLNKRYGSLLPVGYVFRLPTEAEYEWALIAEKDGELRNMDSTPFDPRESGYRAEFDELWKKRKMPKEWKYTNNGRVGDWHVGGRVRPTTFGVYDMIVAPYGDVLTLDTYDVGCVALPDGRSSDDWRIQQLTGIVYKDKEVDPLHYAGHRARKIIRKCGQGRCWDGPDYRSYAHIVVGPDVEKPFEGMDAEPYAKEAFGGHLLSDMIKDGGRSSKHEEWRNTPECFERLLSTDPIILPTVEEDKDCRGFHTQHETSPWIRLDLEKKMVVTGIQIEAIRDPDKSWPIAVWASEDGKHYREIGREMQLHHRYLIDLQGKNVKAKYIRVGRLPGYKKEYFFLDKILVYGRER